MVIFDGAMGTELQRRGYDTSLPLWSARSLLEHPDAIEQIHRDFAEAGADVLTTNTFRTHRRNLEQAGLADRAEALSVLAVSLCRKAARPRSLLVAGSISPLQDCYSPKLSPNEWCYEEHLRMATWLADAGCDLLLVETMPTLDEAMAATRAAKATGMKTWVSVVPDGTPEDIRLLDETPLANACRQLLSMGPDALLVNCAAMELIEAGVAILVKAGMGRPSGGYANNGFPNAQGGWRFDDEVPVGAFVSHCARLQELGAAIVGGCCGTTPDHIRAAASVLA